MLKECNNMMLIFLQRITSKVRVPFCFALAPAAENVLVEQPTTNWVTIYEGG